MPTISSFCGIFIKMFFYDTAQHNTAHIHVEYNGKEATYSIINGSLLAGKLPAKQHKLVVEWIKLRKDDLKKDLDLAVNGKAPKKIQGLK